MMTDKDVLLSYSPFFPPGPVDSAKARSRLKKLYQEEPRKPDWLLVLISALVLLTLLIAWLVGIPDLFHQ